MKKIILILLNLLIIIYFSVAQKYDVVINNFQINNDINNNILVTQLSTEFENQFKNKFGNYFNFKKKVGLVSSFSLTINIF